MNVLLRKARIERGWTQAQLAHLVQVDEQTVRSWEQGKRAPFPENGHRLCDVFGMSLKELGLELEPEPIAVPQQSPLPPISQEQETLPLVPTPALSSASSGASVSVPLRFKKRVDDNRRRMLHRVKTIWIDGVLANSLVQATLMVLGLRERPDALLNPWHWSKLETDRPPRLLPPGTTLLEVYDEADGELLILGEPGAGKTTALLTLLHDLLDHAFQERDQPIPVVFVLSEWANKKLPLDEWLIEELSSKYRIPPKVAQNWIRTNQLLLLLDGLDEMAEAARSDCVAAINSYRQNHDFPPVVISCRREEYFAQSKRLGLQQAIQLEPLSWSQIDDALLQAGQKLEGVRKD